ncbi:hypothetical protein Pcinc_042472 [Petrolisthes cinctipes]|uniref:Uncharacterized protein n=1 Tax=Petrolisthes cinctipes TaxID=88211 RepID=A0AAE1BHT0_PETCI|nr:hypothetical protein Pcinc_042472 [Petrolisthes cinctipes]
MLHLFTFIPFIHNYTCLLSALYFPPKASSSSSSSSSDASHSPPSTPTTNVYKAVRVPWCLSAARVSCESTPSSQFPTRLFSVSPARAPHRHKMRIQVFSIIHKSTTPQVVATKTTKCITTNITSNSDNNKQHHQNTTTNNTPTTITLTPTTTTTITPTTTTTITPTTTTTITPTTTTTTITPTTTTTITLTTTTLDTINITLTTTKQTSKPPQTTHLVDNDDVITSFSSFLLFAFHYHLSHCLSSFILHALPILLPHPSRSSYPPSSSFTLFLSSFLILHARPILLPRPSRSSYPPFFLPT